MKVSLPQYLLLLVAGNKRILVYTFLLLAFMILLWRCCNYLFIAQQYTVNIDSIISDTFNNEIKQYTQQHVLNKSFSSRSIRELQSQFTIINKVDARYTKPGHLYLTLHVLKPIICINTTDVMLENGSIAPKKLFREEILNQLPTMTVAQAEHNETSFSLLKRWIEKTTLDLFERFKVRWINHTKVELEPKQNAHFCIITDHTIMPTHDCLSYCDYIQKQLSTQSARKIKDQTWGVDIRFKNQFIVHSMHKGVT